MSERLVIQAEMNTAAQSIAQTILNKEGAEPEETTVTKLIEILNTSPKVLLELLNTDQKAWILESNSILTNIEYEIDQKIQNE